MEATLDLVRTSSYSKLLLQSSNSEQQFSSEQRTLISSLGFLTTKPNRLKSLIFAVDLSIRSRTIAPLRAGVRLGRSSY
jgi:hypothetical protein